MDKTRSLIDVEFGGWPFLDPVCDVKRLLTAVACTRWARWQGPDIPPAAGQLAEVLTPERAVQIRRLDLHLELPSRTLAPERGERAAHALGGIGERHPQWAPLLALPVRLRQMIGRKSVSASSFAWPQHVFLADAAFTTDAVLAEQLLHELSHQWLYLVEELRALQHIGCARRITLPSGTSGRSVSELLGAVHVVANLRQLWRELSVDDTDRSIRLRLLEEYGAGCLQLVNKAWSCLTADGQVLAHRLMKEFQPA